MPPVGFEPTISAGERPQTYALDRAATGAGYLERIILCNSCAVKPQLRRRGNVRVIQSWQLRSEERKELRPLCIPSYSQLPVCGLSIHEPLWCLVLVLELSWLLHDSYGRRVACAIHGHVTRYTWRLLGCITRTYTCARRRKTTSTHMKELERAPLYLLHVAMLRIVSMKS